MNFISNLKKHPDWPAAEKVCKTLIKNGYKAYLAGGVVRDVIMGRDAHDIDVATDASSETVESLFPNTIAIGKKFGIITVMDGNSSIEVARFRSDGNYIDGRHPESVEFSNDQQDAERRDFTINGIFFDIEKKQIVDYVNGQKDIEQKTIRAIGDPEKRFQEDHLRILRAIRFAAQLGFKIENKTLIAIQSHPERISSVSVERVQQELVKMLMAPFAVMGVELFIQTGLYTSILSVTPRNEVGILHKLFQNSILRPEQGIFYLLLLSESKITITQAEEILQTKLKAPQKWVQFILKTIKYYYEKETLLTSRPGQILTQLKEVEFCLALETSGKLGQLRPEDQEKYLNFKSKYQNILIDGDLPKPLLNGNDLKPFFQGAQLGEKIKEAFYLQLEGQFKDKKQALDYFSKVRE